MGWYQYLDPEVAGDYKFFFFLFSHLKLLLIHLTTELCYQIQVAIEEPCDLVLSYSIFIVPFNLFKPEYVEGSKTLQDK